MLLTINYDGNYCIPPSISLAVLAISSDLPQLLRFIIETISGQCLQQINTLHYEITCTQDS